LALRTQYGKLIAKLLAEREVLSYYIKELLKN
jgi:hypothetical protein